MAFIQKIYPLLNLGDHSEWGLSAEKKEVNKPPKLDEHFDIQHQLETLIIWWLVSPNRPKN